MLDLKRSKPFFLLFALALMPVLIYAGYLGFLYDRYSVNEADLASVEMRLSRLQGLYQNSETIIRHAAEAEAEMLNYVYSADQDPVSVATLMQQQLREVLLQAGVETVGSQILSPQDSASFQRIRIHLRVTLGLEELEQLVMLLNQQRPLILIDQLLIQPVSARGRVAEQTLNVQLHFVALRAVE